MIILWGELAPMFLQKNLNYKRGAYGHLYSRIEEAKQTSGVDLLFLGSSHTYRGFDPRVFQQNGLHTFNLGSSSQSPLQTEILLKRYLDQIQPKRIIYEVCPSTFNTDGIESTLDLIANDRLDKMIFNLALQQNHIKIYNALLFASYRRLSGLDKGFVEAAQKEEDLYISGGYVERSLAHYEPETLEASKWTIEENQLAAFERIITYIQERDIPLILVQAPFTQAYKLAYGDMKLFDELMEKYASYHNFNKSLLLNDQLHFYDEQHLNQTGVNLFNSTLIQVLGLKN
jgi:hypothetical protein